MRFQIILQQQSDQADAARAWHAWRRQPVLKTHSAHWQRLITSTNIIVDVDNNIFCGRVIQLSTGLCGCHGAMVAGL